MFLESTDSSQILVDSHIGDDFSRVCRELNGLAMISRKVRIRVWPHSAGSLGNACWKKRWVLPPKNITDPGWR